MRRVAHIPSLWIIAVFILEHAVQYQEFLAAAMGVGGEMAARRIAHHAGCPRHFVADTVEHLAGNPRHGGIDPGYGIGMHGSALAEIGMEELTGQYVASRTEDPGSAGARAFAEHMRRMRPEIYLEQSVSIARLHLAEAAGKISVPTLILVGENDASTPIAAASTLAEAIEGARLEIIPEANHLSVLDRPEVFAGHVAAQLDALDAGEGRS